jgi:hypothetical protein
MKEPFLYKDSDPIEWPFSQLVEMVEDITQIGCLDELVAEADRAGIVVLVPPEAVNFVKRYLFQHGYHKTSDQVASDKAGAMIRSASCSPGGPGPGGPPVFPPTPPGDPPPM